jgi:hypothetical protein
MSRRRREEHEKKLRRRRRWNYGKREADGEAWLSDDPLKVEISCEAAVLYEPDTKIPPYSPK